jgi:hypothetical protein
MAIKDLEKAMLYELREVAKNNKLIMDNIMEWSTGEVKTEIGEVHYYLPNLGIHCAVKL